MQFVIIRNSMRKCILILLLFWLTACSEHKLLKREITDRIEGITLAADDFIGSGFIGVNDNLLLFQSYDPDSLAVAYSMDGDALNLCGHFLLKGRGPKEFDQPYCRMSQTDVHMINCDGNWKSAGLITTSSDSICYKSIPEEALYILDNLTRGTQIRVFSYDDGVQEWDRPERKENLP